MALQKSGGAVAGAQLDRIQLNRQGKVIIFDYKKYLDTGDFSILPKIEPLDVVFVPASPLIGNVQMDFDAATLSASGDGSEKETAIKVFGEVLKPGVFSYKAGNTVVDMLMRAGGVTRYAGVEHIRVINDGSPINGNVSKIHLLGMPHVLVDDVIKVILHGKQLLVLINHHIQSMLDDQYL